MHISAHLTWSLHMDYPLYRWYMENISAYVYSWYISFVNNHEENDISSSMRFILERSGAQVFSPPKINGPEDWRNKAIHQAYSHIQGTHVLFTEQDFFLRKHAWDMVYRVVEEGADVVAYNDAGRIHPAFLLVKKGLSDMVKKDFSPVVDKHDHFYKFVSELRDRAHITTLDEMGLVERVDYLHMSGLTHNYSRIKQHLPPTRAEEFYSYNYVSKTVSTYEDSPFQSTIEFVLERAKGEETHPFFDTLLSDYHS